MLKYSLQYNIVSPFPIHDTEYINKLIKMKDNIDDYNNEPVYVCKHCKSLHIILDEENNDVCHRCGSINEITRVDDINMYDKKYGYIWKIVNPSKHITEIDSYKEKNNEKW